ncbi:MAG: iron-sulfur cluster assembly scaffold protein [Sphingomonadales bacterium]
METLYTREILRLALGLEGSRLDKPDVSVTKHSRVCGSTITIDVNLKAGRVSNFGAEVKACALGQASTAIVEKQVFGKTWADLNPVYQELQNLLAGKTEDFPAEWKELEVFVSAQQHKARHSAILLPFKALEEAFKNKS